MDEALSNPDGPKTLSTVPFEKGFHFTTDKGVYTGITATSLTEFVAKLETIDETSVLFHYPRGDFQKWIQASLGDKELADRLCFVERDLTGEKLRGKLLAIVQKRLSELQKQLEEKTQPPTLIGEMGGENMKKAEEEKKKKQYYAKKEKKAEEVKKK